MAEQTTKTTKTTAGGATRPAKVNQYEGMFLLGQGAAQDQTAALNLIRGMIERATLHGGQLQAGPRTGGGFTVRALLPYRGAS